MKRVNIADYLLIGAEHATTARELANILHCDIREITASVENARRQGEPIIASCDAKQPGYYLAATAEELQQYCNRLHHRAGEIYKTRSALLETAQNLQAGQEA